MKLGLIRHFKVIQNEKTFLSSREFANAMNKYDSSPVKKNGLQINTNDWEICYCSSLPRAVTTAETIYDGEIIKTDLIKEVPISPFTKLNIKLPSMIWHIAARIAWYKSHKSQTEDIFGTKKRINEFYEMFKNSGYEKILIVSHGYFLRMFYEEMKKKGFDGDVEVNIRNGKLYTIAK
ncbi:MAG: histidine phosphatase family protein [Ignavibacteriales bacterium]|nr:histidine phosphatase family protein [Ignavibacteriales bacterium]MCB9258770.1 histidine phosphatase family protein [Ignavibacteriales bacterium]